MKCKFTFLNLFLGCISLFIINTKFTSNVKAEDLLKVELNTEIKKGKFLIGLKQYLGGENDSFCLLYTSPSPRDRTRSRMPSSA